MIKEGKKEFDTSKIMSLRDVASLPHMPIKQMLNKTQMSNQGPLVPLVSTFTEHFPCEVLLNLLIHQDTLLDV